MTYYDQIRACIHNIESNSAKFGMTLDVAMSALEQLLTDKCTLGKIEANYSCK